MKSQYDISTNNTYNITIYIGLNGKWVTTSRVTNGYDLYNYQEELTSFIDAGGKLDLPKGHYNAKLVCVDGEGNITTATSNKSSKCHFDFHEVTPITNDRFLPSYIEQDIYRRMGGISADEMMALINNSLCHKEPYCDIKTDLRIANREVFFRIKI